MSYKLKLVEKKDPIERLEASKSSIKDLLNDLLNETNGFKQQITLKVTLKNTKALKLNLLQFILIQQESTVINHKFSLENAFEEILFRIDNWFNEGFGWIVEFNRVSIH